MCGFKVSVLEWFYVLAGALNLGEPGVLFCERIYVPCTVSVSLGL